MNAMKLVLSAAVLCAIFLAVSAPTAAAQQGDRCAELRGVLDETAAPAVDPSQQSVQTAIHNAVQAGYEALQCAGSTPVAGAIELRRELMSAGYQSRCPAIGQAPTPPLGRLTTSQFNAAVPAFNSWAEANNGALTCRSGEVRELRYQAAIAGAAVAAWNWRTQRQVAEASVAFSQAQPRGRSR
ncbi:MAG: hypothetical protein ABL883_07105 [Terricaulis sp.]